MNDPLDGVISHPGDDGADSVPLDCHLQVVSDRMVELGSFTEHGEPSDADIAYCIGRLHDFGKVTPAFQQYVREEYYGEQRFTYHSRIGAFAVAHALSQLGVNERDQLAGFLAVIHHHGQLHNTAPYVAEDTIEPERKEPNERQWVQQQVTEIRDTSSAAADELLRTATDGAATWVTFEEAFASDAVFDALEMLVTEEVVPTICDTSAAALPDGLYDRFLRYWGALIIADKTHASAPTMTESSHLLPESLELDALEDRIEELQEKTQQNEHTSALNERREDAREEVVGQGVNRLRDADADVGLLTLPTGLGKTFTGISAAFMLRDRIHEEGERDCAPTVVYALPFTSIIEQTREHFEDERIWGTDPASREFTVHHYLSDTVTTIDTETGTDGEADTDADVPPPSMLGESWRSGVVLTTFVQLFESLAGPRNVQGLKLPALTDSVVILDEPQALPKPWWPAIRRLTRTLTEEFDARVVSMTATQPTLFTEAPEIDTVPLLTDIDEYFEATERVTYAVDDSVWDYHPDESPLTHEAAASRIVNDVLDGRSVSGGPAPHSAMAVCNTILSSRRLTEHVEKSGETMAGTNTVHIGEIYETMLEELTGDAMAEIKEPSVGDRPESATVAAETLRELGFEHDEEDDWIWPDEPPSGTLFVGTFNSRYRPYDRQALIQVAEVLATADVPFVFVSTQAVEAGVDISFARVYRDLAPLDSVVQAAGRCNRSFEWGERGGEVTLWFLADPDDPEKDPPATYVYETPDIGGHLALVADTVQTAVEAAGESPSEVSETTFTRDAIQRYFDDIDRQVTDRKGLVTAIEECDGKTLGRASLIDETYQTVDVIVAVTDLDRALIGEMGDAFRVGNKPRGFELLNELVDLRVSVPVRDIEENLPTANRVDRRERGDTEGVNVFVHTGQGGDGTYALAEGGFAAEEDDPIARRFTT